MTGYLKTSDIVDMDYLWIKENHLFKNDYIGALRPVLLVV